MQTNALTVDELARALTSRLREDLHLAVDLSPRLLGLAAPVQSERITAALKHRHLGIMFQVGLGDEVA